MQIGQQETQRNLFFNKFHPPISSSIYGHMCEGNTSKNTHKQKKHLCKKKKDNADKYSVFFSANLSRGGQKVDGGQKHPATTRLLTLVHLQELDYSSAGSLWKDTNTQTHEQTIYWMESDSSLYYTDELLEQWLVM